MTDIDDLLTLPVEDDDDQAADRSTSDPGMSAGVGSVATTELIAFSSSEARLATALLLQAQALEGMRREQADLLKRVEAGPSRAALVRSLGQVEAALKQVARLQQKARDQIARTRRHSTRLIAALLILTLGLAGVVGWVAWTVRRELPASLRSLESRLASAEASRAGDIDRAVSQAVVRASSAQSEALAAITNRLDGEQQRLLGELVVLRDESDSTRGALNEARTENTDLRRQIGSLGARQAEQDQQLSEVRQERNRQIGENARLVADVLESEQRLQELAQTVATLRAAQPLAVGPVASAILDSPPAAPDGIAGRVTSALKQSGAPGVTVVEVGAVSEGALQDVLLQQRDPNGGSARLLHAERGRIVIEDGRARLHLQSVREPGAEQAGVLEIELPALDAAAWRDLGVTVPGVFTPLPQVMAALDGLLAGQGWRVTRLASFDGDMLGGLELVLTDENGIVQRSLEAASGSVRPTGPELELRDGSIRIGEDERPFYRGVFLLPLPGSDYGEWLAATDGSER